MEEGKVIHNQNYPRVNSSLFTFRVPLSAFSASRGSGQVRAHCEALDFAGMQAVSASVHLPPPHTPKPSLLCANLFSPQEHMLPLLATTLLANSTIHL